MKKIIIGLALVAGCYASAQQAGKAGERLKNEASVSEMGSSDSKTRVHNSNSNNSRSNNNNNSGFRNRNTDGLGIKSPNYQWNPDYGYSEVFLRIPEQGFFSVEVGDQYMSNNSGRYRFFDLPAGRIPVSIYESGDLVYRTTLNVRNNSRMVLDFFTTEGLYLLDTYPVPDQSYGFGSWNDVWNNPYGAHGDWNNSENYPNVMNDQDFQRFFSTIQEEAWFDDKKIAFIKTQGRYAMFTSKQISTLVKDLSFDKNKIALAKLLFPQCVDKHRYFMVGDALDFESSRKEVMDYISHL
ncbi:DUF4476 domain-containing protein [uncultured Chryseobacterium sp.]|uniref:DUF4476 domain-containing protein n=1 Tax=uncultured Chryseobacterium sp. TaxID=259322 RepID=UPI0025E497F2|nr:DUF4476 domain-containing protein [uncultured Chryseobacterium sp.]